MPSNFRCPGRPSMIMSHSRFPRVHPRWTMAGSPARRELKQDRTSGTAHHGHFVAVIVKDKIANHDRFACCDDAWSGSSPQPSGIAARQCDTTSSVLTITHLRCMVSLDWEPSCLFSYTFCRLRHDKEPITAVRTTAPDP